MRRIAGAAAWHGVLIVACAFVLVPIVMVVLGSFKTVNEFFASPYGLPESFGLHNYQKALAEANLPVALRNSVISTGLGVAISTRWPAWRPTAWRASASRGGWPRACSSSAGWSCRCS